ncbi:MAG: pgaC [Bacillales bacterium]|nr:pgaC [Bacillales bacterium]
MNNSIILIIMDFVFWYPLIMSVVWLGGSIIFYFKNERKDMPLPTEMPFVSILVPCYNEEENISETVENLISLNYPSYEIVTINDGSKDNTAEILKQLSQLYSNLKVIDLKENRGKANALYLGLIASKGEILLCIDADSLLDEDAIMYMIPHFVNPNFGERVGAVTGNPRVRNRSSLLAKIQLTEFSSIIGMIKRTQRVLGKVMTVSGVIVAFRKRAVLDCGLWDRDLITDDIGITWKLQRRFWDVRYEPRALCWMLVPETLKGLWAQRVRWAQGGIEVLIRHFNLIFEWEQRRLIPILLEQTFSVLWSVSWILVTIIYLLDIINTKNIFVPIFWSGSYLTVICLIQFLIAMILDNKYDKGLIKYYLWSVWYPIIYWYFNAFVLIWAIPKALKKKEKFAIWQSPDRGISE